MYPPVPNKNRVKSQRFNCLYFTVTPSGFYLDYHDPHFVTNVLTEDLHSQGNSGWQNLRGSRVDVGGPFFVYRNKVLNPSIHITKTMEDPLTLNTTLLKGDFTVIDPTEMGNFPPPASGSEMDMNRDGATAIARAAPGTSPMNLATALGELKKDGLPSSVGATLKDRSSIAKKAGGEYLNAQFGWAPLVRDVKSLAKTVISADDILNQLERDAGQTVRRRLTLTEHTDNSEPEYMGYGYGNVGGLSSSGFQRWWRPGSIYRQTRTYRKVWFSGSFTYYLPPEYYSRDKIRQAAAQAQLLYGVKLTPEVLWNLAPWSWAADWFSNAGDVVTNTQRFLTEGLVMHHGYLMEHTVRDYIYWNTSSDAPNLTTSLRTETKSRVKANPFGFGTDFSSLSAFQTSILVALGMSRGR